MSEFLHNRELISPLKLQLTMERQLKTGPFCYIFKKQKYFHHKISIEKIENKLKNWERFHVYQRTSTIHKL